MTMEIKHQVFSLESIIQYFARGLQFPNGKHLFSHTYYVDPTKGKVVLEMIIEEFPISAGEEVELVGTDDTELAAIVAGPVEGRPSPSGRLEATLASKPTLALENTQATVHMRVRLPRNSMTEPGTRSGSMKSKRTTN